MTPLEFAKLFARRVQAALAIVPPVDVLVLVQLFVAELKFSLSKAIVCNATVEEENRSKLVPVHTEGTDALADTGGAGTTKTWIDALVVHPFKLKV